MANEKVQEYVIDVRFSKSFQKLEKIYDKFKNVNQKNVNSLERAQKAVRRSALFLDEARTDAEKLAKETVRKAVADAKSADELRDQVAAARSRLRVEKKNTRELKKQSFIMKRMKGSVLQMAGTFGSVFAIGSGVAEITRIGQSMESAEVAMLSVSGSSEEAAENMAFVRKEATRLGVNLVNVSKDYTKVLASARNQISKEDTESLFVGVLEASTALGLSADQTSGSLRAIQQMLGKTKVTAEELRNQLAERLPGSVQLMAKAAQEAGLIGKEVPEGQLVSVMENLMQNGKLMARDVLPEFAKQLKQLAAPGLEKALKSNRVAMGRMQTALADAANSIFKGGLSEGLTQLFNTIADFFNESKELWSFLGSALGFIAKMLANIIRFVTPAVKQIGIMLSGLKPVLDGIGNTVSFLIDAFSQLIDKFGEMTGVGKVIKNIFVTIGNVIKFVVGHIFAAIGLIEELVMFLTNDRSKRGLIFNRNPQQMQNKQNQNSTAAVTNTGVSPLPTIENKIVVENKIDGEEVASSIVSKTAMTKAMDSAMYIGMGE